MIVKERMIGMLTAIHDELGYYSPHHAQLAAVIAAQAAVAIENARLYTQAQELAALKERSRLARELHDSVSQALYGIALAARTSRTLLDRDPPRAAEPLDYVLTLAEAGLAEMRALIFELRPESLEVEGLIAALDHQLAALHARHGIAVEASLGGTEPDVPYASKEAMYRVAQEALHNVVKHARASAVKVTLGADAEGLTLEVCDDGQGFEADGQFPGHLGLRTMQERAVGLGGSVRVQSTPGSGTRVHAWIPNPDIS
jgi:signal transduction histidine kinase